MRTTVLILLIFVVLNPTSGIAQSSEEEAYKRIPDSYAVGSSFFTGASATFSLINCIQASKHESKMWPSVLGLAVGLGHMAYGAGHYYIEESKLISDYSMYHAEQRLTMFNIALGTITTGISTWALLSRERNNSDLSFNVYPYTTASSSYNLGIGLTKVF